MTDRRTRARRAILVVGGVLALAAIAWGVLNLVAVLGRTTEVRADEFAAPRTLDVRTGSGDVELRPSTDGRVRVETRSRYGLSAPDLERRESEGALHLEADCNNLDPMCDVDYDITVPDGVVVLVDTGSGDVSSSAVTAGLTLRTGSGDIRVADAVGPLDLRTGSGNVEAFDLGSDRVEADTGSGDIDLRLVVAPSQVDASTGSGDVDIRLPDGAAYAVDADTGSGDISRETRTDPASEHRIKARTGSGDIAVRPAS